MIRTPSPLAILFALLVATPATTIRAQGAELAAVSSQFALLEATLATDGFQLHASPVTGSLVQGGSDRRSLELAAGVSYQIIGVCDNDCTDLDLCWFFLHGCLAASNRFVEEEIPEGDEDKVSAEEKKLCSALLEDDCRLKGDLDRLMQYFKSHLRLTSPDPTRQHFASNGRGNPYLVVAGHDDKEWGVQEHIASEKRKIEAVQKRIAELRQLKETAPEQNHIWDKEIQEEERLKQQFEEHIQRWKGD